AARVAAHAVGHDEQVVILEQQQAVLVAPAAAALIGLGRGAHQDERVDAGRLVERGVLVVDDGHGGGRLLGVLVVVGRVLELGGRRLGGRACGGSGRGLGGQGGHRGDDL